MQPDRFQLNRSLFRISSTDVKQLKLNFVFAYMPKWKNSEKLSCLLYKMKLIESSLIFSLSKLNDDSAKQATRGRGIHW